jgi:hypothetical protein
MKKVAVVGLAVAGLLTVLACAADPGVTGTVTDKDIERPKGKSICYELEITDASGVSQDYCVRRGTYDQYEVGDKYPKG